MAKVKAIKVGYYNHRRIKVGDVFQMNGVNDKGFYIDDKKAVMKDAKGKDLKCRWVSHVSTKADKFADPKVIAAVLSGKTPGIQPEADTETKSAE